MTSDLSGLIAGGVLGAVMLWSRPLGIGFLMLAVLALIAVRVEIGSDTTSWLLTAVYAGLGAIAAVIGVALMVLGERANRRR
jgi:hypothetical protein